MDFADKKVAKSNVIVYSGENLCQFQKVEMEKLENSQSSIKYLHTVKYLLTNQKKTEDFTLHPFQIFLLRKITLVI